MANSAKCSAFIFILLFVIPVATIQAETVTVVRVVDGDTCILENGERVRYYGINAPEKNDLQYQESIGANADLVVGKEIRLERGKPPRDKYGRILAYIFVDDLFVNEELVRQGYAHIQGPLAPKYKDALDKAQMKARQDGRGIWAKVSGRNILVAEVHADAEGKDRDNLYDEYIVIENRGGYPVDLNGWTVFDETSRTPYLFSSFILEAGARLTLRTGKGKSTHDELFWGSRAPIWNNDGDTIFIRDSEDQLVLSYVY